MHPAWIYLDNNATTAPAAEAVDAMTAALRDNWANASSSHDAGQNAKQLLGQARVKVARFLGCKPTELVFTSGATEANHMALRGAVGFNGRSGLVLSAAEHAGMQKLAKHLSLQGGGELAYIGLQADGSLDMAQARSLITDRVALVSVMAANNETGVLMPIGEIARLAHAQGAMLHVDATQLLGKLPFDFSQSGADLVSVSAHKCHGPKGVGALVVRQGLNWPVLFPGSQERGRRGGTENIPGIAGFAAAAERLMLSPEAWLARSVHMASLRDRLEQGLQRSLPGTEVYGQCVPRLPNTSYLRFGLLHADLVLNKLGRLGVQASSGSACSAGGNEPSPVLLAMDVPRNEALCAVRLSLSAETTQAEIDLLLQGLPQEVGGLMAESTAPLPHPHSDPVSTPGVFA